MVEASLVNLVELVVLVVGVVIALFQLQGIKKTRQAELFMQVYNQFTMEKYKQLVEMSRARTRGSNKKRVHRVTAYE